PPGRKRLWAIVWTGVFAIGNAVAGIVTLPGHGDPHDHVQRWVHNTASIVSAGSVFLGALAIALEAGVPRWARTAAWLAFWVGGVAGSAALPLGAFVDRGSGP